MTKYVLSIDPGVSTGIALLGYKPGERPTLEGAWQFTGGARALKEWLRYLWIDQGQAAHGFLPPGLSFPLNSGGMHLPVNKVVKTVRDENGDATGEYITLHEKVLTVIAEKFTARNTSGFSYTTASLEPLRGEGVLLARDVMPDYDPKDPMWRVPSLQYLVGGKDLADKKKRQHRFLKDIGMYRTNKDFPDSPSKDGADDFRSACAHGLAYLARVEKHKPTYEMISEWVEEND